MKKVVLASLLGVAVSQATGCIITTDDDDPEPARINASWQFVNIATNTTSQACPVGFPTVELFSQLVDANGNAIGPLVSDLFTCADGAGRTAGLEADRYKVWLEVQNDSGSQIYAQSLAQFTDLLNVDQSLSFDIHNDGGFFSLSWTLQDAFTNAPMTCAAATASGVAITATFTGTASAVDTEFACSAGFGVSAPLLTGNYEVSVAAVRPGDVAGKINPPLNRDILTQNRITELGTVAIPIDNP
jgi:hypothetical protein